jgi:4-hydroxybenzoyl-CoA thioesterase
MFQWERPVRFAEVDQAGLVFFPHFGAYCHDTLERFFEQLPGGYPHMVGPGDTGIPTVHFEADFESPLKYGDIAVIELGVEGVGRRSVSLRYTFRRKADGVVCARIRHTIVVARMSALASVEMPAELRALFEAHRELT